MKSNSNLNKRPKETEAMLQAKGKNQNDFPNVLFSTVDDFFWEMGIIKSSDSKTDTDN